MSNVDAPEVGSGETNIPDLLAEQSGMPNMSSTKTFVVDTNMQVNGDLDVTGTVTATSFIGDGSQLTGISGGTGGGLDSAAVTLLVDSDYVQARETPQDFAYSSLTGAPTALSSFTNDTSYITAADIPTTVDSAYVQARVTLDGVGLDSAGVTALVDSDYVALRAPAGGGLDSAGVQLLIDAEVQDPTTLTLGASSNAGIGIGSGVVTNGLSGGSVSIGTNANSYINSIAIGSSADASGTGSVSVGPNTQASGNFNTAIGRQATTSGSNSLALGYSSSAGNYGIALGDATTGQRSIAIGALASATGNGALHINANYNSGVGPTADGGLVIETASARLEYSAASDWTFDATVNAPAFVGDGSGLTNLPSGGGLDSDAVIATMNEEFKITTNQVEIGSGAAATNGAPVAIGRDALAKWTYAVAVGQGAEAGNSTKTADVAIGFQAIASGSESIALGRQTIASSLSSIAIGNNADATNANAIAIGKDAETRADYAVAIGENATVLNPAVIGIAIGRNTSVTTPGGVGGIAIGSGASVSNNDTLAIGRNTVASAADATAIGPNTTASGLRSIAIGNNVTAITDDAVTIGSSVAGRVTYDTTNDWTFGAGVTMTDLTSSGVVIFSALPTTDPVNAGQLWNDAGTLKVSAG